MKLYQFVLFMILLLILMVVLPIIVMGQCVTGLDGNPTCASGAQVTANTTIGSGDTLIYCGGPETINGVQMDGGVLHVCGELTLTSFTFNSGKMIVATYGVVDITGNKTLNNNCYVINYGEINFSGNVEFQNDNNHIYNVREDAIMTIGGRLRFAQNTNQKGYFANMGYFQANDVTIRDGCSLFCLEDSSYTESEDINYSIQNTNNLITYSGGTNNAIWHYTGNAFLANNNSKSFTTSSSVEICKATGATETGNGSWGSATITNNCTGQAARVQSGVHVTCPSPLPVQLISFEPKCGTEAVLEWRTASEINSSHFVVEQLVGEEYQAVGYVPSAGNSTVVRTYNYSPEMQKGFFRLKQVDLDGEHEYLGQVSVSCSTEGFHVYPNPFQGDLWVSGNLEDDAIIRIYSMSGGLMHETGLQEGEQTHLDLSFIPLGIYFIQIESSNRVDQQKIIRH